MNCPKCGRDNPDSAPQCATCGAVLMPPTRAPRTSGLAIASLVCSLTCIGGILGIILGIVALRQIALRRDELGGSGLAIAGIVVGGVLGLLVVPGILAAMLFPVFARARESARKTQCVANVKNIALAVSMYAVDYGAFPASARWEDDTAGYVGRPQTFVCPDEPSNRSGYAYPAALAGRRTDEVTDSASEVSIFESDRGWNAAGDLTSLPPMPRHLGGDVFGFADGHAKWYRRGLPGGPTGPPGAGVPSGMGSGY